MVFRNEISKSSDIHSNYTIIKFIQIHSLVKSQMNWNMSVITFDPNWMKLKDEKLNDFVWQPSSM